MRKDDTAAQLAETWAMTLGFEAIVEDPLFILVAVLTQQVGEVGWWSREGSAGGGVGGVGRAGHAWWCEHVWAVDRLAYYGGSGAGPDR